MKIEKISALLIVITLSACGEQVAGPGAVAETASRQLHPGDQTIAEIYNRSCRSCHTVAATGAPLTGDIAAWRPRLDKGMSTLLDNVINGFAGMPPLGLCMDCDVEQFEALIQFMAAGE
ncbi:MAG: c-type cytochrome [Halioglobus sp.]